MPASYTVFGNNGSTGNSGSVEQGNNTALSDLINPGQSTVLSALTTATDHLPVVADYSFTPVPEPGTLSLVVSGVMGCLAARGWQQRRRLAVNFSRRQLF